MAFINGLSSAFPDNIVHQDEVKDLGRNLFSSKTNFEKMEKVYDNSGVKTRYLCEDLTWYMNEHNWSERNFLFKKNSLCLLKKCITETIEKTNICPKTIGGIIFVNSTGLSTPSIDAEIFNLFNFTNEIVRLPIFGYGCAGGVLGLNRAIEIYKNLKKPILVCNLELCSLTFRPQIFNKENIVSSALFGDGSISYLVQGVGCCKIKNNMEYTWKNSLGLMGWGVEDDGLSVNFDKNIPEFIRRELPSILDCFPVKNFDGYILHSGGMKIINAYRDIFENNQTIQESQEILMRYGNVSSVSVLLVLKQMIEKKYNGNFLMTALGPGFTAGLSDVNILGHD